MHKPEAITEFETHDFLRVFEIQTDDLIGQNTKNPGDLEIFAVSHTPAGKHQLTLVR